MSRLSITPNITVTIGHHTRLRVRHDSTQRDSIRRQPSRCTRRHSKMS
jgi:hypothetical protein